jgi:asparagine synthase (glutamine-hydrolysing)
VTGLEESLEQTSSRLKELLYSSVQDGNGDSILLSGGLDTSIITAIATSLDQEIHAFTVVLKDSPAPDLEFSKIIATKFGIQHDIIEVSFDEIESSFPKVIKTLKSFDPMEVRNSVVVFLGLERAESEGFRRVLTGDAADELFAGYSFVISLQKADARASLKHLWEVMHFSSIPLAKSLGIEAVVPFLDERVRNFATEEIPFEYLVGKKEGQVHGKYLLRKAFESAVPAEIVWRKKTPIEYGSGTTILPQIYSNKIRDNEFRDKRLRYYENDGVKLRDKEQLHYYEIYRITFGPPAPDRSLRVCLACNSNVANLATFCATCGEYPI